MSTLGCSIVSFLTQKIPVGLNSTNMESFEYNGASALDCHSETSSKNNSSYNVQNTVVSNASGGQEFGHGFVTPLNGCVGRLAEEETKLGIARGESSVNQLSHLGLVEKMKKTGGFTAMGPLAAGDSTFSRHEEVPQELNTVSTPQSTESGLLKVQKTAAEPRGEPKSDYASPCSFLSIIAKKGFKPDPMKVAHGVSGEPGEENAKSAPEQDCFKENTNFPLVQINSSPTLAASNHSPQDDCYAAVVAQSDNIADQEIHMDRNLQCSKEKSENCVESGGSMARVQKNPREEDTTCTPSGTDSGETSNDEESATSNVEDVKSSGPIRMAIPPAKRRRLFLHVDETEPMDYMNKRVAKSFENEMFFGTITDFFVDAESDCGVFWHVEYDDGDSEDLDKWELLDALGGYEELERKSRLVSSFKKRNSASDAMAGLYKKRRVAKLFDDAIFFGTVTHYDYAKNAECGVFWHIEYDDGDREDLDRNELIDCIDLYTKVQAADTAPRGDSGDEFVEETLVDVLLSLKRR